MFLKNETNKTISGCSMAPSFYKSLEDKFRGSRDEIKRRLEVYLPFINPLKEVYVNVSAIDLGCGRGEWLELLRENSFLAQGVDLDEGMLSECYSKELNVKKYEAIAFLKQQPDESQLIISGFHLAEHLLFDDLKLLIKEALRVLKPAGLLILETPNPENIVVGSSKFYLDPTHKRPIPPQLLEFLPEYYEFYRTKIVRLQESPELKDNGSLSLLNVITGVSPDYAVVAQKKAAPEFLKINDDAFQLEYGITLEFLAGLYQQQLDSYQQQLDGFKLKSELLNLELQSVYKSRSWRMTEPVRWLSKKVKYIRRSEVSRFY